MVENWFSTPIYYNDLNNFDTSNSKKEIFKAYDDLEKSNILTTFNGTSSISYNTEVSDVLNYFNMIYTKELILQECYQYVLSLGIKCNSIHVKQSWVIGYKNNQYQGEHNHGYEDNGISGVFYVEAPQGSSPIIFSHPIPYNTHSIITSSNMSQYTSDVEYAVIENRIVIFPNYLRHRVPNNSKLDGRRLAFVFNAYIVN
jgi:uncharacterized protein (TIGR02466 family)